MFVQYLNERQQAALLHYAHEVMHADNVVEAEEAVHMEILRSQARPGVEAEDIATGDLPGLFEDRLSRVAMLLELVGMGLVDGKASVAESGVIRDLASALDIDEHDLDSIESWVKRQLRLVEEAHELMEG